MVGNSHVGKSCMLLRYTENLFTNNFYNTIGVDFVSYYFNNILFFLLNVLHKNIII
jgi:GTPase SAR1 family protein